MKYVSTRGRAPVLSFEEVLLTGLARDGGLYVPECWPRFSADDIRGFQGLSYTETAVRVMAPFLGDIMTEDALADLVEDTYANFDHPDVAPLKKLGEAEWIMELFHGPTLAFKDYALQFLGRLFGYVLEKRGEHLTIVGATSGDTGSAAIEGCRGRDAIDIFILHPEGRVTEVQRRQMTTVHEPNVHNIAVQGTFDDCQDMVKAMFNDQAFRDRCRLSAVNSINWARIVAQIVFYFRAGAQLGAPETPLCFTVPTGNFGNVFAGYVAREMGLPVEQFIVGANRNDILTRFFLSGRLEITGVVPTISPSMDIQVSSNFERMLFELIDRDGLRVAETMDRFREQGAFSFEPDLLAKARSLFDSDSFDDDETKAVIRTIYEETGELIDPHSAIGLAAGRNKRRNRNIPMVAMATAHPAKFPQAVEEASGIHPELPENMADLYERKEHFTVLSNDLAEVQSFILDNLSERGAP